MPTESLISIIANVALTLSFIVAVIFGIAQVRAAARDRQERLTMETLRTFQTREFAEMALYVVECTMPATRQDMMSLAATERAMIFQFSMQMEALGMLVAEQLISIDLVDKTLGVFVVTTWDRYKPMFVSMRTQPVDPDPFIGEYFQWLAECIEKRMAANPRKPYFETGPQWLNKK